jgi:hypothetical protein
VSRAKQEPEVIEGTASEVPASEEKQPDAVLIIKRLNAEGGIETQAVPLGNVQATEVQTLIELGLQSWRKSIGL